MKRNGRQTYKIERKSYFVFVFCFFLFFVFFRLVEGRERPLGNDEEERFSLIGSASLIEFLGLQSAFVVSYGSYRSAGDVWRCLHHQTKYTKPFYLLVFLLDVRTDVELDASPTSWKRTWQFPAVIRCLRHEISEFSSSLIANAPTVSLTKGKRLFICFFSSFLSFYIVFRCGLLSFQCRRQIWLTVQSSVNEGLIGKTISCKPE